MRFAAKLIKTKDKKSFLFDNCTFINNDFWIYEGEEYLLDDELTEYEMVAEGIIPCLGDFTKEELAQKCHEWFGVKIRKEVK